MLNAGNYIGEVSKWQSFVISEASGWAAKLWKQLSAITELILPCVLPVVRVSNLRRAFLQLHKFPSVDWQNIHAWIINYTGCSTSDSSLLQDTNTEYTRKRREKN